jgi:hypothetical protein
MHNLLAATRRALETIRPPAALGGRLGNLELGLMVGAWLLVTVSAAALFVRSITDVDPAWPNASPIMLYLIEVGRALGAS